MEKEWPYAQLSQTAKQYGGPEKFVNALESYNYSVGKADGKKEQLIFDLLVFGTLSVGYVTYRLINIQINKFKQNHITELKAQKIRNELIQGMEDNDSSVNEEITEYDVDVDDSYVDF